VPDEVIDIDLMKGKQRRMYSVPQVIRDGIGRH